MLELLEQMEFLQSSKWSPYDNSWTDLFRRVESLRKLKEDILTVPECHSQTDRCCSGVAEVAAGVALRRRPKAILFAPNETSGALWNGMLGNLQLALDSAYTLNAGKIELDAADAKLGPASRPKRRRKRRGDRAANIESLRNELIQHLRAARDHAFATKERTGEAELLPRPTQKALGERVGLTESDVSRCLNDENANALRLYWETAENLDQIMRFKGAISTGRKT